MTELSIMLVLVGAVIVLFSRFQLRLQKNLQDDDEDLDDLQSMMGMAKTFMQMIGVALVVIGIILFLL